MQYNYLQCRNYVFVYILLTTKGDNPIKYNKNKRKLFLKQRLFSCLAIDFHFERLKKRLIRKNNIFIYLFVISRAAVKCCGRLHLILGVACLIYKCRLFKQGQKLLVCSGKRKILIQKNYIRNSFAAIKNSYLQSRIS